ncbi:acyl-CoA carboxylase epsilon subunit [Streptomyces hoynatensis]|uniref:acyl-CoA carboxylase epsilon subunit n=1 Tax=Streptomyces hoynatensis TaxID=1141874 RepID=UPI001319E575|nr:acyl-CoA carboxylase epsilon subunit [Streptomyces hoynatensis]
MLRGNPGEEELAAAVTALLAALAAAGERPAPEPGARWSSPAYRMTRAPGSRAVGAWRAGAWS